MIQIPLTAEPHLDGLSWRADNGPSLNAGLLVALLFSRRPGPVLLRNTIAL